MSADVKEDSIIEFGVHWIEVTSRAVYEEEEREEIESGEWSRVELLFRGKCNFSRSEKSVRSRQLFPLHLHISQ